MSEQQRLTAILAFLNLGPDAPFEQAKNTLQATGLCRYLLQTSGMGISFSLLTREEVKAVDDPRPASQASLQALRQAVSVPAGGGSLLTGPAVVFPEDGPAGSGVQPDVSGRLRFVQALHGTVEWFRTFMAGCERGRMDIRTLNAFPYSQGLVMAFAPSKNPMNPALEPAELYDLGDDLLERKLLYTFVYPFIFSGQGGELAKVRRCRNCDTYFLGRRVSATFCGSKCRGAFYYEHSK